MAYNGHCPQLMNLAHLQTRTKSAQLHICFFFLKLISRINSLYEDRPNDSNLSQFCASMHRKKLLLLEPRAPFATQTTHVVQGQQQGRARLDLLRNPTLLTCGSWLFTLVYKQVPYVRVSYCEGVEQCLFLSYINRTSHSTLRSGPAPGFWLPKLVTILVVHLLLNIKNIIKVLIFFYANKCYIMFLS